MCSPCLEGQAGLVRMEATTYHLGFRVQDQGDVVIMQKESGSYYIGF